MSIRPKMEYMERAVPTMRSNGHFSRRPYIDLVIPSLTDPSVAPPGRARAFLLRWQYAPYKLAEGHVRTNQKEAFGNNVIDTIAEPRAEHARHHHRQNSS